MKNPHSLRFLRPAILAAGIASLLSMAPPSAHAAVSFLGVASGDVSTSDAVVWSRAVDSAVPAGAIPVTLQVSPDQTFPAGVASFPLTTTSAAAGDSTVKATVTSLQPGTRYYYRFIGSGGELSIVGTFKTAPTPATNYPLHFAFSGDCDGLIRPYALASQLAAKQLDFFMFDGDTEYETSASIGSAAVTSTGSIPAPSSTGATQAQLFTDFSRKYREQFLPVNPGGQNCLQSFFAGQGNYTTYDNHELGNKQYINGGAPAGGAVGDFSLRRRRRCPREHFRREHQRHVHEQDRRFPDDAERLHELPADQRARHDQRSVRREYEWHPPALLRQPVGPECDPDQHRLPQLPRHPPEDGRRMRTTPARARMRPVALISARPSSPG